MEYELNFFSIQDQVEKSDIKIDNNQSKLGFEKSITIKIFNWPLLIINPFLNHGKSRQFQFSNKHETKIIIRLSLNIYVLVLHSRDKINNNLNRHGMGINPTIFQISKLFQLFCSRASLPRLLYFYKEIKRFERNDESGNSSILRN